MVKINFGAFTSIAPGWINYDNALRHIATSRVPFLPTVLHKIGLLSDDMHKAHKENVFKQLHFADARKKIPQKDNSVDVVYTSHMVEHLFRDEARNFFKESYRVLKKGGIFRILVPDLESEALAYTNSLKADMTKEQKLEIATEFVSNFFFDGINRKEFYKFGHRWLYDFNLMEDELKKIGFKNITKCEFRKGKTPDLEIMEHRPRSLFVEAEK